MRDSGEGETESHTAFCIVQLSRPNPGLYSTETLPEL